MHHVLCISYGLQVACFEVYRDEANEADGLCLCCSCCNQTLSMQSKELSGDDCIWSMQALQRTKAIWYLGGSQEQAGNLHSSSGFRATISAVHFPLDVWTQHYTARFATEMQPSALWIGEDLWTCPGCVPCSNLKDSSNTALH